MVLLAACSTPLEPYSQLADDTDEDSEEALDAGFVATDAGARRDSGTPTFDSGILPRDAGTPTRDAGTPTRDAGRDEGTQECRRVPTTGVTSLITEGCSTRARRSCVASAQTPQQVVNQRLTELAKVCGTPARSTVGVVFDAAGCPSLLGYDNARIQGAIARCLESALESERIGCSLACAVTGPASTQGLN